MSIPDKVALMFWVLIFAVVVRILTTSGWAGFLKWVGAKFQPVRTG